MQFNNLIMQLNLERKASEKRLERKHSLPPGIENNLLVQVLVNRLCYSNSRKATESSYQPNLLGVQTGLKERPMDK